MTAPSPQRRRLARALGAAAPIVVVALVAASCGPEPSPVTPDLLAAPKSGDVRTEVVCPAGSKLESGACVASVSTECPGGTRFEAGRGCVAISVASPPPVAAQPATAPAPASAGGRGPAMARIPAGRFSMGSNDGTADEKPVHQVALASFEMDVTEVTTAQYEACVRAGTCQAAGTTDYCNAGKSDRQGHPINCVSWDDATAFCGWAGRRLPTEEEWEYAARGTDSRTYPWGSGAPGSQLCWNREISGQGTCAVGSFASGKSPFGVQDMAGNVWEWTSTAYCPYSGKNCAEAARVARGGSWDFVEPSFVRASVRLRFARALRDYYLGFRCAR